MLQELVAVVGVLHHRHCCCCCLEHPTASVCCWGAPVPGYPIYYSWNLSALCWNVAGQQQQVAVACLALQGRSPLLVPPCHPLSLAGA